ncbi:carboxyvinyl-carboxyphosphonate phosphorylmutase [Ectocarpus siliculosus]|uniref:Carboxyvinyl-carboxyphosphonate phosphorylmutase n=1 Tax=Ectocarpus siliculosus TaxID=2880 RepID=D7FVV1_ECTSI|nr:carboxyvinyl-carboxyphosphonate phosphorylmutase [Ectocarpus siliculosus]|eukprot:CBJ25471.1 carboxyvinyl-carboxyphosphonate phosphorylmutase [Ectocarpus siliculosus]
MSSCNTLPLLLVLVSICALRVKALLPSTLTSGSLPFGRVHHGGCSSSRRTISKAGAGTAMSSAKTSSAADKLRDLLSRPEILTMPCCYDGLTARLVEDAGFPLTFMTGFGVSGAHGLPDTQLLSYAEMLASATNICATLRDIPCIGDGDTGYGNSVNVKRTVKGYAQVGMAGIMIEDQVAPKRCGHTKGKTVVGREEAYSRVRAACDARDEGADILIMARTDARAGLGLEEALERCKEFRKIGADITFLEAPQSEEEMRRYCQEVDGPKLANMLEFGKTPILPPVELEKMGYAIAAYPLSLLSASIKAMNSTLERLKAGEPLDDLLEGFEEVQRVVGFRDYDSTAEKYKID